MVTIKTIFFTFILLLSSTVASQSLRVVTENLPPLQMQKNNGLVTGAMVDVVNLLLKRVNIEAAIEIYPWARSYKIASGPNNTLIFSMYRDESREEKFQWIGKLLTINSYLVALKSEKYFNINSISDAKKYSIGAIRGDLAEHYLLENGFIEGKNFYLCSNHNILWHLLYSGRTDLALVSDMLRQHELKEAGLDPSKVKLVYKLPDFASDLYLAASLDVDKTVVERLKAALSTIKANGEYQQILQKWHLKATTKQNIPNLL